MIKEQTAPEHQRGQIIVLLALAMVGLLVAAGLAVDGGVLFMRKAQLDRAIDSAALAGVIELPAQTNPTAALNAANTAGQQLLAANRIITTAPGACPAPGDAATYWATHDYCGSQLAGSVANSVRYHIEVRWRSEVYFMQLLGFQNIPLRGEATAEYIPLVDIFASDTSEYGLVRSSNQSVFGPGSCSNYGDAYSPTSSAWYPELNGVYTYRLRIPASYPYDDIRVELFDPDTSNQAANDFILFGLNGAQYACTCGDTADQCQAQAGEPTISEGGAENQINACLLRVPNESRDGNPFWIVRIDENRNGCSSPSSYSSNLAQNTRTLYRLFYYELQDDGSLHEVDLAYYIGKADNPAHQVLPSSPYTSAQAQAEARATDMHWVTPGAPASERMPAFTNVGGVAGLNSGPEPATLVENCEVYRANNPAHTSATRCSGNGDFIIDLDGPDSEVPGIYVDPATGRRDIYMQVRSLSGSSENGFEVWAGPLRSADPADHLFTVPAEVNARQIYILRAKASGEDLHDSNGVGLFGIGHLPMNSNVNFRVDIPLAYLGPEFSGQQLSVNLFDPDSGGTSPIMFFFDTIAKQDWTACYDDNTSGSNCVAQGGLASQRLGSAGVPCNNCWLSYNFTIPSEANTSNPIPFYGGRLIVSYVGGTNDTFGWKIVIDARPFLVN